MDTPMEPRGASTTMHVLGFPHMPGPTALLQNGEEECEILMAMLGPSHY